MIPETMRAAMEKPKSQKRRLFWPLMAPSARKRVTKTKRNPGAVSLEERLEWAVAVRVEPLDCWCFGSLAASALGVCMERIPGGLLCWIDGAACVCVRGWFSCDYGVEHELVPAREECL